MAEFNGTIRKLGLEGGLWALITDDGSTVELIDPPEDLKVSGRKAKVVGDREGAEVSIGMVGDAVKVRSYELL
ncbi:MAG: hypothetical protein JRH11_26450 [Deltaproteobacteria bacterium]|nr:hypothetical protein [Deltaproteobacteria bacterium]